VFKAHRLVYHSTLGWRVMKKEEERTHVRAREWRNSLRLLASNDTPVTATCFSSQFQNNHFAEM